MGKIHFEKNINIKTQGKILDFLYRDLNFSLTICFKYL